MSAPDSPSATGIAPGVSLATCRADVTELAALHGRAAALQAIAAQQGLALPPMGRVVAGTGTLRLCVRPDRWLLLGAPEAAGTSVARWHSLCGGSAAAVDQSSGLAALYLAGTRAREVLARGCRLDLAVEVFPPGHAAATAMAQVSTILAALPAGVLILTPASTARHLREWLTATAQPFGLAPPADVSFSILSGHPES